MRGVCLIGVTRALAVVTAAALMALMVAFGNAPAEAGEGLSLDELLSGVVQIKTFINPDGYTRESLGREREGTGIVIDDAGLVLTIGYLMVEAHAAEITTNSGRTVPANVVAYDNESGFGLLQAITPLNVRPLQMGKSADVKEGDRMLVAGSGGQAGMIAAHVVAKREFAGNWEYLLDEAIFTAPPHPAWSGAGLISHDGKLVGIGSLIVGDTSGKGEGPRGNMFVPIDRLAPILADLISEGHSLQPAHPWLGLNTDEVDGRLVVSRVSPGAPAEKSGLRRGDVIVGVGANSEKPKDLPDLYRKIWAQGAGGTSISLDVLQDHERRHFDVPSINRLDRLKLKSTF
jgi:S1-C subfamily serine protease